MKRAVLAVVLVAGARLASAQAVDVPALVKLCETQPAGVDRSAWGEQRRDAARKLIASHDKRALPELEKLATTEAFDIIGDIAIEGLGNLGDASAVPTLQKIATDAARDKNQRDLAVKALKKLGATPTSPSAAAPAPAPAPAAPAPAAPSPAPAAPSPAPPAPSPDSDALRPMGGDAQAPVATLVEAPAAAPATSGAPTLADDVLAASERIQFAGGTADLGYDNIRKRLDFDADVAGSYAKRIEREQYAWGWDGGAHVVGGYIDPTGRAMTRGLQLDLNADGEGRFYKGGAYVIGRAAAAMQFNYVADVDANNPDADLRDTRFQGDVQVALGIGYGRILDIGARIRVRRIERALTAAHALGKPIDAATSKRLQLAWWSQRSARSAWGTLTATVAILRQAGVLLGEPDAGTTYDLLEVLRDTQLFARPSGLDVNVQFGEGYLQRPDDPQPQESGRVEQLLLTAGYATQLANDTLELSANAYARYRLFAPMDQPSPWAIGATGSLRRFTYGEHGDPFGALDATLTLASSDDDLMNGHVDAQLTASLGYTFFFNQASGIRLAGNLTEDRGDVLFALSLSGTYGLLDGTFAR
ncbi:MAG TPA: HEAT repeat domain-containing protein [Kofleriaceae bacterium]|jgi:hypothetical protein